MDHRSFAANINLVWAWIQLISTALITIGLAIYAFAMSTYGNDSRYSIGDIALIFATIAIGGFFMWITTLVIRSARAYRDNSGGGVALIIFSILNLLLFPLGTLLGIYTIIVMISNPPTAPQSPNDRSQRSALTLSQIEQMRHYGVNNNGKYFECGEFHFDSYDDAISYAMQKRT